MTTCTTSSIPNLLDHAGFAKATDDLAQLNRLKQSLREDISAASQQLGVQAADGEQDPVEAMLSNSRASVELKLTLTELQQRQRNLPAAIAECKTRVAQFKTEAKQEVLAAGNRELEGLKQEYLANPEVLELRDAASRFAKLESAHNVRVNAIKNQLLDETGACSLPAFFRNY